MPAAVASTPPAPPRRAGGWRDVGLVTVNELADALRSRRAIAVLILFLVGLVLGFNGMLNLLHRLEKQIAETLQLEAGGTGTVTESLWKSPRFRHIVEDAVDDKEIARGLIDTPPTALIYGYLAWLLTPLLIMLTATPRIAEEVSTGSIRFTLFRTSRPAWVLGKFLGQALMVLLALLLSMALAWGIAAFRVKGLDLAGAAGFMALFTVRVFAFSLPFIGLALGVSQLCRSPHLATVLGFILWTALNVLTFVAERYGGPGWAQLWTLAGLLTPGAHGADVWRMDAPHVVQNVLYLVALAGAYLAAGYARLARKDL
jgi:ABC-type transport system involved in multi-copper enzyme maturation permease subunit